MNKTIFAIRRFVLLGSITFLVSCGSGSDSTPTFTRAESFLESISLMNDFFNISTINRFKTYDAAPSDLINVFNWTQTDSIFNGLYLNFVVPGQGFANVYPQANGSTTFIPWVLKQELNYSAFDFASNANLDGEFQAFFGVKDVDLSNGNIRVPALIVIRGIVKLNGTPLYGAIQIFEGYLLSYDIVSGPSYDGNPGSLYVGHYSLFSTERYHDLGFPRGLVIEYDNYLVR